MTNAGTAETPTVEAPGSGRALRGNRCGAGKQWEDRSRKEAPHRLASAKKRNPRIRERPRRARPDPGARHKSKAVRYFTALIMSKIGRYIATIIPPTTTPSTTIMMGSMADSSASTAASTSSS